MVTIIITNSTIYWFFSIHIHGNYLFWDFDNVHSSFAVQSSKIFHLIYVWFGIYRIKLCNFTWSCKSSKESILSWSFAIHLGLFRFIDCYPIFCDVGSIGYSYYHICLNSSDSSCLVRGYIHSRWPFISNVLFSYCRQHRHKDITCLMIFVFSFCK